MAKIKIKSLHADKTLDVESWDYFRTCVYTPSEYVRDLRELRTTSGKQISYHAIYSYFAHLCREQQDVLTQIKDNTAAQKSMSRFHFLREVDIAFVDGTKKPFSWLSGRVFVDWRYSFPLHLEMVLDAMITARRRGIVFQSFKVSGLYSPIETIMRQKVEDALRDVEDIHIFDSPTLLDFMTTISLPSIRRLELGTCWIWPADLERVVLSHANSLRFIHLEDAWLLDEKVHDWGIRLCSGTTKTISDNLADILNLGILQELTINKKEAGLYEYRECVNILQSQDELATGQRY